MARLDACNRLLFHVVMKNLHLLTLLCCVSAVIPAHSDALSWKAVWEWSMPKRTEADLVRVADAAQGLGFNAILMAPPTPLIGFMRDQCHQRGMKLYYSTVFAGGDKAWRQVMSPEEQARAAEPENKLHMSGGEPVLQGEVFRSPLPCYNRPEVREFFRKKVIANAALPVDGLAFDYTGYENYRRCYCPVCEGTLAAYRKQHPRVPEREAERIVFEQIIVDFTNEMAAAAREAKPGIGLTVHIYPWFAPEPYWGHRTDIDYVGQTVSWFFRPHWPLQKVRERTAALVRDQHRCYPQHTAAPFVAFDARKIRNYRAPERVAADLRVVKESGATALQMAELGYVLAEPKVAEAVARELGGSYRAEAR